MIGRAWLTRDGFHWADGTTWHIADLTREPKPWEKSKVECYEVEWDGEGKCRVTGRREMMTVEEALGTESMECAEGCGKVRQLTIHEKVPVDGMGEDCRWRCEDHRDKVHA